MKQKLSEAKRKMINRVFLKIMSSSMKKKLEPQNVQKMFVASKKSVK